MAKTKRNPFSVPREQWDYVDRSAALMQGIYVLRVKSQRLGQEYAGLFDVAQVARLRISTIVWDDSVDTACVTESGTYFSPKFFDSLTLPKCIFVMLHEALHILMRHLPRMKNERQDLANVACDLAINSLLRDWASSEGAKCNPTEIWPFDRIFELPDEGCFPGEGEFQNIPDNLAAEDYYAILKKMVQQIKNALQQAMQQAQKQQQQGQQQNQQQQSQQQQQQQQQGGQQQEGGDFGVPTDQQRPPSLLEQLAQDQQDQQQNQQNQQGQQQNQQGQQQNQQGQQGQPTAGQGGGDQQSGQQGQQGQQSGQQSSAGQQGNQQGNQQENQQGDGDGEIDEEKAKKLGDIAKKLGLFGTDTEDAALDSQMQDLQEDTLEKARENGFKDIDEFSSKTKIQGGLTRDQYQSHIDNPGTKDGAKSAQKARARKQKSAGQGVASRGVDALVDRSDDDSMWNEMLEPLRQKALTTEKSYAHKEIDVVSVACGIGDAIGEDIFLQGCIEGYDHGGEVLFIVDTSGSTGDYWSLSVAKAVECLSAMENNSVVLRVVLFSSGVSLKNEYIFFNGMNTEASSLDKKSVLFEGKEVYDEHIVDVAEWIAMPHVDIAHLVGTKIVGGGGTELLPIIQHLRKTLKEELPERFLVSIILTDAALDSEDWTWATSDLVYESLGPHVNWMFLDLYGQDYAAVHGEHKYLIQCR